MSGQDDEASATQGARPAPHGSTTMMIIVVVSVLAGGAALVWMALAIIQYLITFM
jgi:hypothetical protein